jgi:hypothetical protein
MYEVDAEYFDHVVGETCSFIKHCCRRIDQKIKDRVKLSDLEKSLSEEYKKAVRNSTLEDWYEIILYEILRHPHKIAFDLRKFNLGHLVPVVKEHAHIEYEFD